MDTVVISVYLYISISVRLYIYISIFLCILPRPASSKDRLISNICICISESVYICWPGLPVVRMDTVEISAWGVAALAGIQVHRGQVVVAEEGGYSPREASGLTGRR